MIQKSNPSSGKRFLLTQNIQNGSGTHLASYSISTGVLSSHTKQPEHKVDHSCLYRAKLRMSRATSLVPTHAFMTWTGKTSLFTWNPTTTHQLMPSLHYHWDCKVPVTYLQPICELPHYTYTKYSCYSTVVNWNGNFWIHLCHQKIYEQVQWFPVTGSSSGSMKTCTQHAEENGMDLLLLHLILNI